MAADEPTRSRAGGNERDRARPPAPEPLPVPVVDNHCHLDIADGPDGSWLPTAEAVAAAREVGVTRIVQIGCDLPGARWAVAAAAEHAALVAGVSLHPNEAPKHAAAGDLEAALAEIERLAGAGDRVRAVGETGLDYFRTGEDGRAAQHASFRAHIDLAKRLGKTLVIHDRDAHDDVLRILDEEGVPDRCRHALLLRRRRLRPGLPGPRRLAVVRRHRDVQERRAACARPCGSPRATGCSWRPTRRT